ncbi:hypothetical protein FACS189450_13540 [Spirochaetia bacterium]|nr:hypothetical protein FACS189450_13540 [Spirochaetia bacterium]
MRKFVLAIVSVTLLGCSACNTDRGNFQSIAPSGMQLTVEPGEHWQGKMKVFIFSVSKTPQMAAWIENNQEHYISTITVTNRSAKKNWKSAPKEGRPEALPVWNHKMQNNMAQIDTVSAATPKSSVDVQIDNGSLINGQEYNVYLEINHSFDYNDTWPEKENDINGQPSLIYHAKFIAGSSDRIKLNPIGHGSIKGTDGNIVQGLEGMTTALTIIKDAYIIIN